MAKDFVCMLLILKSVQNSIQSFLRERFAEAVFDFCFYVEMMTLSVRIMHNKCLAIKATIKRLHIAEGKHFLSPRDE